MTGFTPDRRRRVTALWMVLAALVGIASRREALPLPGFVAVHAGDAMWALFAYLGVGLLWPRVSVSTACAAATALSLAVELSQLVRAPWLDTLRDTRVGALALGRGFLWSDLVRYAVGIGIGAGSELLCGRRGAQTRRASRKRK